MRKKKRVAINNAKANVSCFANAALTFGRLQNMDELTVMDELMRGAEKIGEGDTKDIERMLLTHAKMLDYLFYDILRKLPGLNMMNQIEAIFNIAFRAQNQSRKALMALAEIKNPRRTMFIKQQNNAVNQQINHTEAGQLKEFKNSDKIANELLEFKENEQWMDISTQGTPIKVDSTMETLEPVNRS
jgi:hypothetical protein